MKKIFESNIYKSVMFIALITVSLLILFSFIDLTKELSKQTMTGRVTEELDSSNEKYQDLEINQENQEYEEIENKLNMINDNKVDDMPYEEDYEFENIGYHEYSEYKKAGLNQTKSNMIFYLIIIVLVASIMIVAISLRTAMIKNIHHEHEKSSENN